MGPRQPPIGGTLRGRRAPRTQLELLGGRDGRDFARQVKVTGSARRIVTYTPSDHGRPGCVVGPATAARIALRHDRKMADLTNALVLDAG